MISSFVAQMHKGGVWVALVMIRTYQLTLSPFIGGQCRFYPTCSHYAREAIETHGLLRGGWLSVKRIGRCHPRHPGGVDEVPVVTTGTVKEI